MSVAEHDHVPGARTGDEAGRRPRVPEPENPPETEVPPQAAAEPGADDRAGWLGPVLVALAVVAVRVAVYTGGDGFHTDNLRDLSLWHLIEPELLRDNPVPALWDVHTVPPLFNFLVGVVLRWSPAPDAVSFQVLFTAGSAFSAVALSAVLHALGCRRWLACVTAVVVFSEPHLIVLDTYVGQEPFVIPMFMGTLWAIVAHARRPTVGRYVLVLVLGSTLVLTRALFHPVWLAAVIVALALLRPPPIDRRRLVVVSALPLVIILAVMAKNQVRFGTFSLSSWGGMNLSRAAVMPLGPERTEALIERDVLSPMARVGSFQAYSEYAPYVEDCEADFGTPALDEPLKPGGYGPPFWNANYNYACFVPVYHQAQRDALAAIRHEPGAYARTVRTNAILFVSNGPSSGLHSDAADLLADVHRVVGLRYATTVSYGTEFQQDADVQLGVVIGLLLVAVVGVRATGRVLRDRSGAHARDVVAVVVALTVAYVSLTSVLMDAFENGRFRAPIDPLLRGAVIAAALEVVLRGLQRLRRRPSPEVRSPAAGDLP